MRWLSPTPLISVKLEGICPVRPRFPNSRNASLRMAEADKTHEAIIMIQQLLSLLPQHISSIALMLAVAGAFVGGILWLGGARFSRTLVTLISVSTGALIGLQVPRWFGLGLEPWATAILGALVFGVSGYMLHKVWVGLGLGLILALWAGLAVFSFCGDPNGFVWPIEQAGEGWKDYAVDVWNACTPETRRLLPFACCAALLSGLAVSILWPRLGAVLLYSSTGMSLLVGLGVAAMNSAKKEWLRVIPNQTSSQLIVLGSMVAFGAILQWRVAPGGKGGRPATK